MGVTATAGLPYPEPDMTPDGAAQIQALAEAVDVELAAIQAGIEQVTTDNLDGNNAQQFNVIFPRAFVHPPAVTLTSGRTDFVATLSGVPTTTGFSMWVRQYDRIGAKVQTFNVHWIGIGVKP